MSTRATYTVINSDGLVVHFYIHHDGYPEGAREYLKAALSYENHRGGLAAKFLRANDNAEIIKDPKAHCDREYHWEFRQERGGKVNVTGTKFDYEGNLQNVVLTDAASFTGLLRVPRFGYITANKLAIELTEKLQRFNDLAKKGYNGNASSQLHEVTAAIDYCEKNGIEINAQVVELAKEGVQMMVDNVFKGHTFESFWAIGSYSNSAH